MSPFVRSAQTVARNDAIATFLAQQRSRSFVETEVVPLENVEGWVTDPDAEAIRHRDGAFFGIVGLRVVGAERTWDQPIIDQPEIGVLGTAVRLRDGMMECLLQAKAEPGTVGGIQLGPTVQATRSNYTRRHGGREVPYLTHFVGDAAAVQGFDVAQSEQGARFLGKHNRNIVTFVDDDLPVHDGYAWFTVSEIHRALRAGDLVNFDARTVLAGLGALDSWRVTPSTGHDDISTMLSRSLAGGAPAAHDIDELIGWLRAARGRRHVIERVPLQALRGWTRRDGRIEHEQGAYFRVAGARVRAVGREVDHWCQPLVVEESTALLGLAVTVIDDVVHVLIQAMSEPGLAKGVELGPTVQIVPDTYERVPTLPRPHTLDLLAPGSGTVLYDQVLSGEGGRFYQARQRHLITLVAPVAEPPGYRWVSLHQLGELVRRGLIVNEQARSLFACLLSLLTPPTPEDE